MNLEEVLANTYARKHPDEAASVFQKLDISNGAALMQSLDPAIAAGLLQHLSPLLAASLIEQLDRTVAVTILQQTRHDVAVGALRAVQPTIRESIFSLLPQPLTQTLQSLLDCPPGSAGSLADSQVLTLSERETVGEAIARLQREASRAAYYLYVLGDNNRLRGVLTIRELFLAQDSDTPIASIAHADPEFLPVEIDAQAMLRHQAWQSFHALPVVDAEGRFLGMVRYETVRNTERNVDQSPEIGPTSAALAELYSIGFLGAINWASGFGIHTSNSKGRMP